LRAFLPYFRECAEFFIAGLGLLTQQPYESYNDNLTVVLAKLNEGGGEKKHDEKEKGEAAVTSWER
jgi:hypothetical protein